jgi:hypothetical protein
MAIPPFSATKYSPGESVSNAPYLLPTQQEFLKKLLALNMWSEDQTATKAAFKALGQEIFDFFKQGKISGFGNSYMAKRNMEQIYDAIKFQGHPFDTVPLRSFVEEAWDGVGDQHDRWSCSERKEASTV